MQTKPPTNLEPAIKLKPQTSTLYTTPHNRRPYLEEERKKDRRREKENDHRNQRTLPPPPLHSPHDRPHPPHTTPNLHDGVSDLIDAGRCSRQYQADGEFCVCDAGCTYPPFFFSFNIQYIIPISCSSIHRLFDITIPSMPLLFHLILLHIPHAYHKVHHV